MVEKKIYFGTKGKLGHDIYPLNFVPNDNDSDKEWYKFIDTDSWINRITKLGPYFEGVFQMGSIWSVYAVPFSVDDDRGGSHTEFWWEGKHTEQEMIDEIKKDNFLKKQFNF